MANKYIKCNCCGKRIYFGEEVYRYKGYCGVYCSADCFADAFCITNELDEELAYDCCCTVYDDEARKNEIRREMEEHRMAMEKLYIELEALNNTK